MTKKFIFLLLLMFTGLQIMQAQQTYSIKGIVKDAANGEPVSFANVVIWNTIEGTVTDSIGQFEITGVSPGSYRLQASFIGYKPTGHIQGRAIFSWCGIYGCFPKRPDGQRRRTV